MTMPSPTQAAANWANGFRGSGEKIKAGVQAVTVAPSQAAIAAIPRMVAGVQAAAADGRIRSGLEKVSLNDWQNSVITKGIPRIALGAQTGQSKMASFMEEFLPFEANVVASLPPRGDTETNIQRATEVMRRNATFRMRGRS